MEKKKGKGPVQSEVVGRKEIPSSTENPLSRVYREKGGRGERPKFLEEEKEK